MTIQPRSARTISLVRRRVSARPVLFLVLTAIAVVAFVVVLYFAGSSVTWFASSPSSDPLFGNLNHCLISALPDARASVAISADARRAASAAGNDVAICTSDDAVPGGATSRRLSIPGVTALAWDFAGALWAASSSGALWRVPEDGAPVQLGDWTAVALAGHARGVVAMAPGGKLVSLSGDGEALGFAELPRAPGVVPQLAIDASGTLVSVVGEGGVFIYSADTLTPLRAEAPCEVEYLWWMPQPQTALLSCGPHASWALIFHPATGTKEAAPARARERSVLLPRAGRYVRACEGFPCEAKAP